jgi:hypothetical protein
MTISAKINQQTSGVFLRNIAKPNSSNKSPEDY